MPKPRLSTIQLIHRRDDPVATVMLNRPDRLNALSRELLRELIRACEWLNGTPAIRVAIVRGSGRAFTGGFDLNDFADPGDDDPRVNADLGRVATEALANCRPLTIAAVHGHCIGGGVVLTSACDLRVAAESTNFVIPEVDLGIPLTWGGLPRLVRELGPAITKELVLTCRPFDAAEARSLRFVNRVVPDDELVDHVEAMAANLAEKPRFSLDSTKSQVNAVLDEIASTARNAADADTLVAALRDPESREFGRTYQQRRMSKQHD